MRILSQNRAPGFIKTSISKEDVVADTIANTGNFVLIHDITNILRVGDLTIMTKEGKPKVLEVKKSGRKLLTADDYRKFLKRGGDLSIQARKVLEIDEAVNSGCLSYGSNYAKLGLVDIPITNYLAIVKDVLAKSQTAGLSGKFVDKLMYIRAFRIDVDKDLSLPFQIDDDWIFFSSLETLHLKYSEPFRNKIPYSCYPVSHELVLQLLSGEIILESYLNLRSLKKRFEKAGWKSKKRIPEIPPLEERQQVRNMLFSSPKLFDVEMDTTMFVLSLDGFNFMVPGEVVGQVFVDFLKPEVITNTACVMRKITEEKRESGYRANAYAREFEIWK